jgi:1,4-dihydroxy-2-naphthoate octaprenyltransferase
MLKKTITILECSRIFSLPMTIMSWLVIFTYSAINMGNIKYGIIALVGLCFAHLGTNLIDDYFDYKFLIKMVNFDKAEYLKQSQKTKCRYLISGLIKKRQLLSVIATYFSIALFCGLFLFYSCGIGVIYFMLIGAFIALTYPFLSRMCLSEIAVALAYGPALFGGVYYVMTGLYSNEVYMLSIPSTLITITLLYIHTIMDCDFDKNEGKKTIANSFKNKIDSLIILKILLITAYLSLILLCIFDILNWQVFFVYLTIPLAKDLYFSLKNYIIDSRSLPEKKWYHFPMENLDKFIKKDEAPFMMRMLQSRNLMIYFSLFLFFSILLSLGI